MVPTMDMLGVSPRYCFQGRNDGASSTEIHKPKNI